MNEAGKTLGDVLRALREDYDLSQGQVASALNIDRSTYTNYELNKTQPNLETLVKLAYIFNVPAASMLPVPDTDGVPTYRDIKTPGKMDRNMSKEERGLIAAYRALTPEQKRKAREFMSEFAKENRRKGSK